MSKDDQFHVCNICYKEIKLNNMPSQKDMFQLSNFPKSFLELVKEKSKIEEDIFHNIDNADVSHPDKIRERYEND